MRNYVSSYTNWGSSTKMVKIVLKVLANGSRARAFTNSFKVREEHKWGLESQRFAATLGFSALLVCAGTV